MKPHFSLYSILVLFVCFPILAHAQSVRIETTPSFPAPYESFTARLTGPQDRSSIRWYIDGRELVEQKNSTSIELEARGLGVAQAIRAEFVGSTGLPVTATKRVVPTRTDLIVTTDTLVPSFYKGRSEPVKEASVTVRALVFDGSPKKGAYTYLWNVQGRNQNEGVPGVESFIRFTPTFQSEVPVVVTVFRDGVVQSEASVVVPITTPEVHFYERNPLRGLGTRALSSPYLALGEEVILKAEPFFINADVRAGKPLWKVGNTERTSTENPYELVLQKEESATRVSFVLQSLERLLQGVRGTLDVQF